MNWWPGGMRSCGTALYSIKEQQLLGRDKEYEPGRIGDLVPMEQRLSNWKVTVFHLSMLARLGLYVFVGLLSSVGAAGVSVVIESVFSPLV